jgi:uncharacterized protein
MGTVGWLLVVAIGIALGYSAGRLWPGSAAKVKELERERDAARADLKSYRQDVSAHFEATAELFDKVTADYRGLYEHLAVGARQLGAIRGEPVELPLAEPERRRLAPAEPGPEPVPQPVPEKAPQPAPEEAQAEELPRKPPPFEAEVSGAPEADAEVEAEVKVNAEPDADAEVDATEEPAEREAAHAPELEEKDRDATERRP